MIIPNLPYADYAALPALNISRLKELKRSPQHYKYRLANPQSTAPMSLGTAAHIAILEPERFAIHYAIWSSRTESGAMSPRRGKAWDDFVKAHPGQSILTADDAEDALHMQLAIRGNPAAMKYLDRGDAEVTIQKEVDGRARKGRLDWVTECDGQPVIVGIKTARDCRPFVFGKQSAVLGYHMQWAWYHDLFAITTGMVPLMKEIVVESGAPNAVAVYHITEDILTQGREDYTALLSKLEECETANEWPGPVSGEEDLTMPSWSYTQSPDDITDLGLEK